MITVGFNGFSRSGEIFGEHFRRTGIDRYRVLGHDAAAAVFVDGELVAAVEEERLSREKKTSRFPAEALRWCLAEAGVRISEVDRFAFPWHFSAEVLAGEVVAAARAGESISEVFVALDRLRVLYTQLVSEESILTDFREQTGHDMPSQRLQLVPHHLAHLMCGYYLRGGGDCAFLVSDGRAERLATIAGELRGGSLVEFDDLAIEIRHSIGLLYSKVTRYLGFVPNNDEYKVMGLSAFCPAVESNPLLEHVIGLEEGGRYTLAFANQLYDTQAYYSLFDRIFERPVPWHEPGRLDAFDPASPAWAFKARVARYIQDAVEVVVDHQVQALSQRTDLSTLLIEGGVGLNCVNNAKVLEGSKFDQVEVSFGASDPGVTIGAACYASQGERPWRRRRAVPVGPAWHTPYVGPRYTNDEVLAALSAHADRLEWTFHGDEEQLIAHTAALLREPNVVGWFQGRAEYGPRALGARSILANPSIDDIQEIINLRVKKREPFRPFAPVVLESHARALFDLGKKQSSPYMTFVFPVRDTHRNALRGACHVDGTARVQTLADHQHPRLAALLGAIGAQTGVPCLINTSFNIAGEPIVCSPEDAVRCFLGTDIDYLVIEDYVVTKTRRSQ